MSLETQRILIETVLQSNLAQSYPNVPMHYWNAAFNQPETMWGSCLALEGPGRQVNMGPTFVERHIGVLQIDYFTPEKTGGRALNLISAWTGDLFRAKDFGLQDGASLRFKVPSFKLIQSIGGFAREMISIAYWRDEKMR